MSDTGGMKLFVWEDVLCDYTCGVIFALGRDFTEAKMAVKDAWCEKNKYIDRPCTYDDFRESYEYREMHPDPEVYDNPIGFIVQGGG